jgi:hypothetical protein
VWLAEPPCVRVTDSLNVDAWELVLDQLRDELKAIKPGPELEEPPSEVPVVMVSPMVRPVASDQLLAKVALVFRARLALRFATAISASPTSLDA